MTTSNCSAVAAIVAIPTDHCSTPIKMVILIGLVLSHVLVDMLPHSHIYDFARLKETWVGAMYELGVGFVLLPIIVFGFTQINLWWLIECIMAASLVDFLVALKIPFIVKLNHWAHRWEHGGEMSVWQKVRWEIFQSTILFMSLFILILIQNLQR